MRFDLDTPQAVATCFGMAGLVVGSLYLVPPRVRRLPRDDPAHIKARMCAMGVSSAGCVAACWLAGDAGAAGPSFAAWLGLRWEGLLLGLALPLAHVALLFAAPLALAALRLAHLRRFADFGGDGEPPAPRAAPLGWLEAWRAHTGAGALLSGADGPQQRLVQARALVVGPLAEEVQFRACMLPLLLGAGWGTSQIVFLSPLVFGAAHLHHFLEMVRAGERPAMAAAQVVFQFLYTSLFGFYEAFCFLRTGQLPAIILVHAFCNAMGLPDVTFFSPKHYLHRHRQWLALLYVAGIAAFALGMYPLTEPEMYGSFTW